MIKNVIFDFGQVLVSFDPHYMTSAHVKNEADILLCKDVLFDRLYWDKLDAGTISDEEVISLVKKRLPERLWNDAEKAYYNWIYNIPEINGMREIVKELKSRGINLCILSNISLYFAEHYKEIPIFEYFDKFVFSSRCGMVKPNKDIFDYTLKKYNFDPAETLFVDDRAENVMGAKKAGIEGYVFDGNVEKFAYYLKKSDLL